MRPGQLTPENSSGNPFAKFRPPASMRPGQLTPENREATAKYCLEALRLQ